MSFWQLSHWRVRPGGRPFTGLVCLVTASLLLTSLLVAGQANSLQVGLQELFCPELAEPTPAPSDDDEGAEAVKVATVLSVSRRANRKRSPVLPCFSESARAALHAARSVPPVRPVKEPVREQESWNGVGAPLRC